MMRSLFYGARLAGRAARFGVRVISGRPMSGQRKTDATFWRPATRSLDISGYAMRWEMMRGAARAAYRLLGAYLLLLAGVLLLLSGVSYLWDLPEYLLPGNLLRLHLAVFGSISCVYVTWVGNVEYGWKLPILLRVEYLPETPEEEGRLEISAEEAQEKEYISSYEENGDDSVQYRWVWRWVGQEGRLQWEKERVLPLAQGLSTMLNMGTMTRAKARRMIHVPRDYRSPGKVISILLPPTFTGAEKGLEDRMIRTVKARLGIEDEISADWQLEGASPRVLISMPAAPPERVYFSHARLFLEKAQEYSPFVGISGGGEGVTVSLENDSPHMAVSAGSGAGKSVLIKNIAMQFRRWGWNIIILDWKEESHEWAKGMDGVRYCTSIEDIHDMCIALGDEVEERKSNPHLPRPKLLVISEEWNITAPLLADYWYSLRAAAEPEERRHMPTRSPALTARMKVNFTGRQLGMSDILVAQRFSARVTNGNADLRESFQLLFMARWKTQTLKMLAGGIKPFPKMPKVPGRWVCIMGETPVVIQVPLVTDEEARSFALSGEPAAISPWVERGVLAPPSVPYSGLNDGEQTFSRGGRPATPSGALPKGERVTAADEMCTLRQAAERMQDLGYTYDMLKHATKEPSRGGDSRFPDVIGGSPNKGWKYSMPAIREWGMSRNAARAAERKQGA
jgi:hypothetical protein